MQRKRHRIMDEENLLAALREGDERAFEAVVQAYHSSLLRLATSYVRSRAVAEEVVQETWLAVLSGLSRFEGRSSLKTWIFAILINRAKTRAVREQRSVPFTSFAEVQEPEEPAVELDRFFPPDHPRYPGRWMLAPTPWTVPEESLLAGATRQVILQTLEQLPRAQRVVITLRDIEGWPAEEVCGLLGVTDANQRVLLHRARNKLRAALERHLAAAEQPAFAA